MSDEALLTAGGICLGVALALLLIYVWEWWCK